MDAETQAKIICNPAITAAQNISAIAHLEGDDFYLVAQELKRQAEAIKSGDISDVELALWSSSVELSLLHTHLQKKALVVDKSGLRCSNNN